MPDPSTPGRADFDRARRAATPKISVGMLAFVAFSLVAQATAQPRPTVPPQALELRNLGIAQLENEKPADAEQTFRRLTQLYQSDPLGPANLAIALLRQQKSAEALLMIQRALQIAPRRADLDTIRGDVLAWQGDGEQALAAYRQAAAAAPADPLAQYALYRHATSAMRGPEADAAAAEALERLRTLRPENLVVLLESANRGIAAADRARATGALLRVRELLFQAPAAAGPLLAEALAALESGDTAKARAPGLRLSNLLKSTPMFRSSLVELAIGIQGNPVARFGAEPASASFGDPLPVRFTTTRVDADATRVLASADFDGDDQPDLARLVGAGNASALELRLAGKPAGARMPAPGASKLLVIDLDNDGWLDVLGFGGPLRFWRGAAGGALAEAASTLVGGALAALPWRAVTTLDFDSEGDLDLVATIGDPAAPRFLRNTLEGPLHDLGAAPLPALSALPTAGALAADLDRDGDGDLLLWGESGLLWLDNLRQGRFHDRTRAAGLAATGPVTTAVAADLDNDGRPELVLGGPQGLRVLRQSSGRYQASSLQPQAGGAVTAVAPADFDNDGRLDLVAIADGRVVSFAQRAEGWSPIVSIGEAATASGFRSIAVADVDRDGDLDLMAGGDAGLFELRNEGGNRNHWLRVKLRGLTTGNDKNNTFGRGASIEVVAGGGYQFREATDPVTHFGLGRHRSAENLRVVWNNGVPQNRLQPTADQLVVEEQLLKGSCPFLYTWNGEEIVFVTDLLWGAPLGMPIGEGIYAGSDPVELVRVDGASPRQGMYDLRITEELWEAAYFDLMRLWVVDHPEGTEAASSLRVFAGPPPPGGNDDRVLLTSQARPVARAWDGRGRDVTERVAARDDVYADGYERSDYQGIAAAPWTFTFDLGAAPGAPVRLLLDGWIFPADASLNVAAAQRSDLTVVATRLEVETSSGWQTLLDPMGFPAGKTKTLVVDTPPLPDGASKLRIVSTQWLHWDRVAWSVEPRDDEARVVAQLLPRRAELRFGGFSAQSRLAPNAPHHFDYALRTTESPWLPMAGPYTRYGSVRELLLAADDRLVVMGAGDEMVLELDATTLPPLREGWRRTLFLESHGWDKDADRNTWRGDETGPMPFRGMTGYPGEDGDPQRDETPSWHAEWLTRRAPGN